MKTITSILAAIAVLTLYTSPSFASGVITAGQFSITVKDGVSINISTESRSLFTLTALGFEKFNPKVTMQFGFFDFEKKNTARGSLDFKSDGNDVLLIYEGNPAGRMTFGITPSGNLRTKISLDESVGASSILMKFACATDDHFWGFGEQYSYIDFRGVSVPVWVSEQGVGRAKKPYAPYIGELTDTYFPMPYFIDPKNGKGFLIGNSEYSKFNISPEGKDFWTVEVWNGREVSFLAFPGPSGIDVIKQLTSETGRPKSIPPDWAYTGVWLAAQGGTEAVRKRLDIALDAGVPVSAVWSQDWLGARHFGSGNFGVRYRWIHDPEWYPGLEDMIKEYRAKGVRFLGYFNNFVLPDGDHYEEMARRGLMVKDKNEEPYVFQIVTFKGGMIDVTNPEAAEYFKEYARKATAMGQSGWMCDFGEWLPFDAKIANGDAPAFHNLYPEAWHRMSREVLEEAYPDSDFVLLTRSGYTGEQRTAQIVWAADQEANFDEYDGIPTVVTAALNMGMSGIPFYSHDISGFSGGPAEKELFLRWTELGAFTPFMRTHDGLQKFKNHRFDSDTETLAFFKNFALIHRELFPYFRKLSEEALATGVPLIRHTALVDPAWEDSYAAHWQWMLGPDILFAPVVKENAAEVEVRFPEGEWEHLFTGEKHHGRTIATVPAPIGTPAVFIRTGRMNDMVDKIRSIYSGK